MSRARLLPRVAACLATAWLAGGRPLAAEEPPEIGAATRALVVGRAAEARDLLQRSAWWSREAAALLEDWRRWGGPDPERAPLPCGALPQGLPPERGCERLVALVEERCQRETLGGTGLLERSALARTPDPDGTFAAVLELQAFVYAPPPETDPEPAARATRLRQAAYRWAALASLMLVALAWAVSSTFVRRERARRARS